MAFPFRFLEGRAGAFMVILMTAATVFALDQASKSRALVVLTPGEPLYVHPFLNFDLVGNPGISFGMLADSGMSPLFLGVFSFAAGAFFLWWGCRWRSFTFRSCSGMIAGGAFGNGADRLRYGAVVDFIDVHVGSWHWPTFNIADSFITSGVAMYALFYFYALRASPDDS